MKLIVNHITIIIVSIVTLIFSYGTITKCEEVTRQWWIRYIPGTQYPGTQIPISLSLEYIYPSIAAFMAGFTASIIDKSKKDMVISGAALGAAYFWLFGYWSHSMLLSVPGTILVTLMGFGGHFAGKNTLRHNK